MLCNRNQARPERSHILIIDDEELIRRMLRDFLEGYGYSVCIAGDGKQALRLFEHYHADLIITDILMPEKDGLEVLTAVRQRWPHIPVIAITGGSVHLTPHALCHTAHVLGATRVFSKPVDLQELLLTVQQLLQSAQTG